MLVLFGKLLVFGIRAAWGISKIVLTIVFLPIILIALVAGGLLYIAFPILSVLGLISLVTRRKENIKYIRRERKLSGIGDE